MHFKQPDEMQVLQREQESLHRFGHHAVTRYEPETFNLHHHDMDLHVYEHPDHQHVEEHVFETPDPSVEDVFIHEHHMPGLPVHDQYGKRTIEHNPLHRQFVYGTNYELTRQLSAPVIEHNIHAFTQKPKAAKETKEAPQKKESHGSKAADGQRKPVDEKSKTKEEAGSKSDTEKKAAIAAKDTPK